MAVNKVTYGNDVLIDISGDTVTAAKLLSGTKAHNNAGVQITGSCTYNSDTSSDTVAAETLSQGVTAHDKNGNKITGTLVPKAVWG